MKPTLDTTELLRRLTSGGVEFIVIGGSAAIIHGSGVTTEDLDVCALRTLEYADKIIRTLSDLRPKFRMRQDIGVVAPDNINLHKLKIVYPRTDAGHLDILGELPEVCSY